MFDRRHRFRNASAAIALALCGITIPLTITKGNEISGGNTTLFALWAAVGVAALVWLLATDWFAHWIPLAWRSFPKHRQSARDMVRPETSATESGDPSYVIGSQRDAAQRRVRRLIESGERLFDYLSDYTLEPYGHYPPDQRLQKMEEALEENRQHIGIVQSWHDSVPAELHEIGGGAEWLYSSEESLPDHTMLYRFAQERITELERILERLSVRSWQD